MGEKMVVDGVALRKVAIDEESKCTGGVCAKRGHPFDVDCGGEVAHCGVALMLILDQVGLGD